MPTLKEQAALLQTKRGELDTIFKEYSDGSGGFKAITPAIQTEIVQRNDELKTLQDEYNALKATDEIYQKNVAEMKGLTAPQRGFEHPKGGPDEPGTRQVKTLGELFTDSDEYKARRENGGLKIGAVKMSPMETEQVGGSVKTLFAETAGYAPFIPRVGTLVYSAQRRPVVADLIPQEDTAIPGTRYMEETLFTNNAAAVAEGGTKPESALQYTERFIGMTKIATTIPVTEEQMMDVPQIRSILDNRLTLQIRFEEERELLQGNPAGANPAEFTGFLNKTGVQTVPNNSAQDDFSAILLGITQVESTVGFADVTGMVGHPLDWFNIRTKQDSTGRFILGNPDQPGPASLWGKTFIPTIAEPQGTILLGDFQTFAQILRREGITFRVGYVAQQFLTNTMTIVVEERCVLIIYRPSAFCLVQKTF